MDDPNADETSQYGQYCPISRAVEVLGERWSVLIVREPRVVVNGFVQVLQFNRREGWIEGRHIKPMDPFARCTPSVISNGKLGIG